MQNSRKPRFLLIGGFASSLINFRGPLLKRLVQDFEVFAAAPYIDDDTREKVEAIGANCISTAFERTGLNPAKDLKALLKFRKQIKEIAPDYVLAYTIKPVVFGLKAAKFKGVKRYALITGKGSGFDETNLKSKAIAKVVKGLYRDTLKSVDGVIFQNSDDQMFFESDNLLAKDTKRGVIEGTGVDMIHYCLKNEPALPEKVKFLFIARLIKEKGIPELVEAARMLREKGYHFEVQLLGWVDPNPGGISQEEVDELHNSGLVNYLGTTDDVRPYIEAADVFVLPTYYNEGLPRTIQEAMAMKKPIITTDHPGCRETVEEGRNGFLIPTRDAQSLADAMERFIKEPEQVLIMGQQSHEIAKEKFDVNKINERLLKFMQLSDV
ncbi:MAG: glycosyltransferase family 4 protein [Roseivirga sp.]|uniref:glycosyltransferase family 4 protein n=1 Tax=Roseivirga sp. TaxID=1964215 RepID=UPI001B1B222C|nr:glycosyltransferase family 4 protein [Roseivirga sp.]MBO6660478.1 glycosyltransferase family 4 protein [Roseivirga sp.]MBO6760434.1 glycosyltransferase family 4 protein [Roseivirga sp.]MBO6906785.1 glycosyltransferase family 4 protein [Roseivirga sp.]